MVRSTYAWVACCVSFVLLASARAKVYDRCELARELRNFDIDEDEIPTWVCIAKHESLFDTSAMNPGSGDHGLFQISQIYWCSPPGEGYGCNSPCSKFRDDDISDDLQCIRRIYNEHKRISGDGYTAWAVYPLYCKGDTSSYVQGCFDGSYVFENGLNTTQGNETVGQSLEENEEDDDGYDFPPLPSFPKHRSELDVRKSQEHYAFNIFNNDIPTDTQVTRTTPSTTTIAKPKPTTSRAQENGIDEGEFSGSGNDDDEDSEDEYDFPKLPSFTQQRFGGDIVRKNQEDYAFGRFNKDFKSHLDSSKPFANEDNSRQMFKQTTQHFSFNNFKNVNTVRPPITTFKPFYTTGKPNTQPLIGRPSPLPPLRPLPNFSRQHTTKRPSKPPKPFERFPPPPKGPLLKPFFNNKSFNSKQFDSDFVTTTERFTFKPFTTIEQFTFKPFSTIQPFTNKPITTKLPSIEYNTIKPFALNISSTIKPYTFKPFSTIQPFTNKPITTKLPSFEHNTIKPFALNISSTIKPFTFKPFSTIQPFTNKQFTTQLPTIETIQNTINPVPLQKLLITKSSTIEPFTVKPFPTIQPFTSKDELHTNTQASTTKPFSLKPFSIYSPFTKNPVNAEIQTSTEVFPPQLQTSTHKPFMFKPFSFKSFSTIQPVTLKPYTIESSSLISSPSELSTTTFKPVVFKPFTTTEGTVVNTTSFFKSNKQLTFPTRNPLPSIFQNIPLLNPPPLPVLPQITTRRPLQPFKPFSNSALGSIFSTTKPSILSSGTIRPGGLFNGANRPFLSLLNSGSTTAKSDLKVSDENVSGGSKVKLSKGLEDVGHSFSSSSDEYFSEKGLKSEIKLGDNYVFYRIGNGFKLLFRNQN